MTGPAKGRRRGRIPVPETPEALRSLVADGLAVPAPPILSVLVARLRARFGESLAAVLLYGSTLHHDDPTDGLVDLYAVVDSYPAAYRERRLRIFNALLPPNVFYVEAPGKGATLRAKYAVLSLEDLEQGTTRWFHSYLWARFAQPARLLYARAEADRHRIEGALAGAVVTFLRAGVPSLGPGEVSAQQIWRRALTLSYAAELRAERDRAAHLSEIYRTDYERLTAAAAPALEGLLVTLPGGWYRCAATEGMRRRSLGRWRLRRFQGRLLSVLRLAKAVFTFENGADYLAWKIERHTGVHIEVTPRLRRHPILLSPPVLWRLLRRGAVR